MKNHLLFYLIILLLFSSCSENKQQTKVEIATSPALTKVLLTKSIDSAIGLYDRRLDIKMKWKFYEPQKGIAITYQKFFEQGDTTKLIKLREEIMTNDAKLEVFQYHFIKHVLVQIHDYEYNKKCGEKDKQCMSEGKYFFDNDKFSSAIHRNIAGTPQNLPIIENANFETFEPTKDVLKQKIARIESINKKYATLPYPKSKQ